VSPHAAPEQRKNDETEPLIKEQVEKERRLTQVILSSTHLAESGLLASEMNFDVSLSW
jgi:hypothetical protein